MHDSNPRFAQSFRGFADDTYSSNIFQSVCDSINGFDTVGELTDRIYAKQQPDGEEYLTLEPLVQQIFRRILADGDAAMVDQA
jgi:hypothetical protein